MSFNFTTNYEDIKDNQYAALPTGEYEVFIESVRHGATKTGNETLDFNLKVRKDLDKALPKTNGKYHNRIIFYHEYTSEKRGGQFNYNNLKRISKAAGLPEKKQYSSADEFIKDLEMKPVRIYTEKEKDTYKNDGSFRNTIKPWNFKETKFPLKQQPQDPFAGQDTGTEISDEDVPF